jgi:hypothetical protein
MDLLFKWDVSVEKMFTYEEFVPKYPMHEAIKPSSGYNRSP